MKKLQLLAIDIIELFENILEENNITIPDEYREGNEEEARIFGDTYYRLEEDISNILYQEFIIQPIYFDESVKK